MFLLRKDISAAKHAWLFQGEEEVTIEVNLLVVHPHSNHSLNPSLNSSPLHSNTYDQGSRQYYRHDQQGHHLLRWQDHLLCRAYLLPLQDHLHPTSLEVSYTDILLIPLVEEGATEVTHHN